MYKWLYKNSTQMDKGNLLVGECRNGCKGGGYGLKLIEFRVEFRTVHENWETLKISGGRFFKKVNELVIECRKQTV